MPVTLKNIAEQLGTTHATVSRALRDDPCIASGTRERIQQAARRMGYKPNLLSRGLKTGKTQSIGMILAGLEVEATTAMVMAIEEAAAGEGYRVFGCYHGGDVNREKKAIDELLARKVDGIIAFPVERTECRNYQRLVANGFPVTIVGMESPFEANVVRVDLEGSSRLILQHLVEIGRKKIALIYGGTSSYALQTRIDGWRRGYEEAGIDFDNLAICGTELDASHESIAELVEELIRSDRQFDALVAGNDITALIASKILREHGFRIPEDVAVVGYDNNVFSGFLPIPLTTVRQPEKMLGERAFELLSNAIENPSGDKEKLLLDAELVVRESTRKATEDRILTDGDIGVKGKVGRWD
jgi:LacI family transcriptional regulator